MLILEANFNIRILHFVTTPRTTMILALKILSFYQELTVILKLYIFGLH